MQARLVVVLLFLVACGGPSAGETCMPIDGAVCDATHSKGALFCEGGTFVAFDCPGPNGCTMSSTRTVCDFVGSTVGSSCPHFAFGQGFCASTHELRRCDNHAWVSIACANACTTDASNQVTCN